MVLNRISALDNFFEITAHPDIFQVTGVLALLITSFGWFMAWKVRRPLMFRVKLAFVFIIPFVLAGTYLCPYLNFSATYRMLLMYTFIALLNMLYWRELREMTSSIGYHKKVLVNFLDMVPDMVWMKDIDNQFTYTNKAICEGLLCCTPEEAYGKTGWELAQAQRALGNDYTFGEVCCNSDNETLLKDCACRFLEFGEVNGQFLALEVFKAPLWVRLQDGSRKIVGTIGMGRDLTEDFQDHELIEELCNKGDTDGAMEVFLMHKNRYRFQGSCCTGGTIGGSSNEKGC